MDTVMSEKNLQDVFDKVTREVTEKVGGICLKEGNAVLDKDSCTVHAYFERGFHSSVALYADTSMFTRITKSMLQEDEVTPQDVEDFTKEYFNVLCGQIASELFQVTKVASRFHVPSFHNGMYQPDGQKEQFVIRYNSDGNEGAHLIHYIDK